MIIRYGNINKNNVIRIKNINFISLLIPIYVINAKYLVILITNANLSD